MLAAAAPTQGIRTGDIEVLLVLAIIIIAAVTVARRQNRQSRSRPSQRSEPVAQASVKYAKFDQVWEQLRPSIEAGDVDAIFALAQAESDLGIGGFPPDYPFHPGNYIWWRRAAVMGHAGAMAAFAGQDPPDAPNSVLSNAPPETRYWRQRLAAVRNDDAAYSKARALEEAGETNQAETLYQQSYNAGNVGAAYRLAKLADRHGDVAGKLARLESAGLYGDVLARFLTVSRFSDEFEKGKVALRRLAEAGDVECAYALGTCGRAAREEDRPWLQMAADAGDLDAAYRYGCEIKGGGARKWLRMAAQRGHPHAALLLSRQLRDRGEEDESRFWLDVAAGAGDVAAEQERRRLDLEATRERRRRQSTTDGNGTDAAGGATIPVSPFKQATSLLWRGQYAAAAQILEELAAAGDTDAMFNLGVLAQQQGDKREAERWFCAAANAGDVDAYCRYGAVLREAGRAEEAETWLYRAADAGVDDAACALGMACLESGDRESAMAWWESAPNHPESMYRLALLLEQGGDLAGSEKLYRRAADRGHAEARDRYGDLVLQGNMNSVEYIWELRRRWAPRNVRYKDVRSLSAEGYRVVQRQHEPAATASATPGTSNSIPAARMGAGIRPSRKAAPARLDHADLEEVTRIAREIAAVVRPALEERLAAFHGPGWLTKVNEQRQAAGVKHPLRSLSDHRACLAVLMHDQATVNWLPRDLRRMTGDMLQLATKAAHDDRLTDDDLRRARLIGSRLPKQFPLPSRASSR